MARGLRSSRAKSNKSKLRAKTFGPVEDARVERLSKKLAEISSASASKDVTMDVDAGQQTVDQQATSTEEPEADTMNVDSQITDDLKPASKKKGRTRKEARKAKKDSKRKPRNLITFKTKARNPGARRRRPPRI